MEFNIETETETVIKTEIETENKIETQHKIEAKICAENGTMPREKTEQLHFQPFSAAD